MLDGPEYTQHTHKHMVPRANLVGLCGAAQFGNRLEASRDLGVRLQPPPRWAAVLVGIVFLVCSIAGAQAPPDAAGCAYCSCARRGLPGPRGAAVVKCWPPSRWPVPGSTADGWGNHLAFVVSELLLPKDSSSSRKKPAQVTERQKTTGSLNSTHTR